jgi:hypothetical protein
MKAHSRRDRDHGVLFEHTEWKSGRKFSAVRQDVKRRSHAMRKEMLLFGNDGVMKDYRFSVLIVNSQDAAAEG